MLFCLILLCLLSQAALEIHGSLYTVPLERETADPSKVTAMGPGLEKTGVFSGIKTFFDIYTKGAGSGVVGVNILDPSGQNDTVKPSIFPVPGKKGTYYVEYLPMEAGMHSIEVLFSGEYIPNSPFGVNVAPRI